MLGTALAAILACSAAQAGRPASIPGDRLDGFVLPVAPIETGITLSALRAWAWSAGGTQRLYLDGGARVQVGGYDLTSEAAVIWIDRIESAGGLINQIAAWFPRADNPSGRSGLTVSGSDLLLTGSARGSLRLDVARLEPGPPPRGSHLGRAEARLSQYLTRLSTPPLPALADLPQVERPPEPVTPAPGAAPPPPPPVLGPAGTLWFSFTEVELASGPLENVLTLHGPVVVQYIGAEPGTRLSLAAQRAVVFADPGSGEGLLAGRVAAGSIRGIYLEGNVSATAEGERYTMRAPQVYYDVRSGRAIALEAVLRTYRRAQDTPVHARAAELRQIAADQWTAGRATVSTSEFAEPHLALGARRVTVTQQPAGPGDEGATLRVDSRDNTADIAGVPVLYWPRFAGTVQDVPLRSIEVGAKDTEGVIIRTEWDPFVLLGIERPEGVDARVRADGYTERGPAGGLLLNYDAATALGSLDLYYLHDRGTDKTSSGEEVKPEGENRGVALWEHQQPLGGSWTVQAQASYISDQTYITTWRQEDFYNRREYESALYLKSQQDNAAFDVLVKYPFNDFISNSWLLASRAYQVEKTPEFTYRRFGDALGGVATYSSETRAGRMRLAFEEGTPRTLGVPGAAFGLGRDDSITAAFLAAGFPANYVARFDTRHEFSFPVKLGAASVVPFVVGRLTAYNDDFEAFSSEADDTRWFGAVGVRASMQIQRVDETVESRLFDLHRLRHILEPRLLAWFGSSNVPDGALPVYDQSVESIGGASVLEAGLNSTWQTQRGGAGRWRSVDFLKVDAAVVLNSGDANEETPIPRFFESRPENSVFGNHVRGTMVWVPSDHASVTGEITWDLDDSEVAMGSIGTELRHSPDLLTFIEYRFIEASDNQILQVGWTYQVTPKYRVTISPQYDFVAEDFRTVGLVVERRFPDFSLTFKVLQDNIEGETTYGATLDFVEF
jgi:hypothetical protein